MGGILFFLFSLYLQARQENISQSRFAVLEEAADDVFSTLAPLNEFGFTECTEDNLRIMQAALVNASFAKQIMFYQDDTGLCSTVSGILADPVKRPPPDFTSVVNGAEVWINRQFVLDLTGEQINAIIKLGNYSALSDPTIFTLDEISSQNSLEKIHRAGLNISSDDLGTGYSNFKQLKKINCTYLKVDRTYIADLEDEPIRSSLIPHIINMTNQLGLSVIAEGIVTFDQQVILVGLGIRYGQGAFFGRPMPVEDLVNQLKRRDQVTLFDPVILDG